MILILLILTTLSACGGEKKTSEVISDKNEISLALEPVRQALPRIYELHSGTIIGEYEGINATLYVKQQLNFEKKTNGIYSQTFKTTNKDGVVEEIKLDIPELKPIEYPTIEGIENQLIHTTKLTIRGSEEGTEYRLDATYGYPQELNFKDVYIKYYIDKSGIVIQYTTHNIFNTNSGGTETIENSMKILLSEYE